MQKEIKRGEIYLAKLHSNIGSEQTMIRPIVVCQNDIGNKYSPCCTVIPLSSVLKKQNMPTHVLLSNTKCLERLSIALAEQITTISKERLCCYIGVIDRADMRKIEDAIMIQNGILDPYSKEII